MCNHNQSIVYCIYVIILLYLKCDLWSWSWRTLLCYILHTHTPVHLPLHTTPHPTCLPTPLPCHPATLPCHTTTTPPPLHTACHPLPHHLCTLPLHTHTHTLHMPHTHLACACLCLPHTPATLLPHPTLYPTHTHTQPPLSIQPPHLHASSLAHVSLASFPHLGLGIPDQISRSVIHPSM